MYVIPPWHRTTHVTYDPAVLRALLQQYSCDELNRLAFVLFDSPHKTKRSVVIQSLVNAIMDARDDQENVVDAHLVEPLREWIQADVTVRGVPEREVLSAVRFLYKYKRDEMASKFTDVCNVDGASTLSDGGCPPGFYQSRFESCCLPLPIPLMSVSRCDSDAKPDESARVFAQDIFDSLSMYPRFYSVDNVVFEMETLVFLQGRCLKYLTEFIDVEFYRTIFAENTDDNCANKSKTPKPTAVTLTKRGLNVFGSVVRSTAAFATKSLSDCAFVHGRARPFKNASEKIAFVVVSKMKSFLTVSAVLGEILSKMIAGLLFDTQRDFFKSIQSGAIVFRSASAFKRSLESMDLKWPIQKLFSSVILQIDVPEIDKLLKADELLLGFAEALPFVGSIARPVLDIFFSGMQRSLRQTINDWQDLLASHKDRTTLIRKLISVLDIESALASDPRCLRKYPVLHKLLTKHKKRNQTVENVYPQTMLQKSAASRVPKRSLESFIAETE